MKKRDKGIFNFRKKENDVEMPKEDMQEKAQIALKEAQQAAKQCLRNESFGKYREQYERASQAILDMIFLVHSNAQNTEEFGFRLYGIISELKCLRALLKTVEREAGNEIGNKG